MSLLSLSLFKIARKVSCPGSHLCIAKPSCSARSAYRLLSHSPVALPPECPTTQPQPITIHACQGEFNCSYRSLCIHSLNNRSPGSQTKEPTTCAPYLIPTFGALLRTGCSIRSLQLLGKDHSLVVPWPVPARCHRGSPSASLSAVLVLLVLNADCTNP